jgi:putative MATE family efflux protein
MGDSRRPMLFLMVCCFVNIVADILFVYVLHMGVAGAALATILSQLISALLTLGVLMKQSDESKLVLKQIRSHKNLLLSMLRIGIPAGIQLMMFDFSNLIVQSSVNSFGEATIAAWTAYGKADAWTWQISGALGVSVTTFVGQNFGAQKYDRVRRSVWVCMGLGMAMLGVLSVLEFTFREPLLGIFTTDPEVIRIGAEMMVCIVLWNAIFIPIEVFAGTMRGTGYALPPTVIMCLSVCLFRILWILLAVERWHTVFVLCLAYPISWVLCVLVFYGFYLKGDWLHGRIKALGMTPEKR